MAGASSYQFDSFGWRAALLLAVLAATALLAWRALAGAPEGQLQWNGEHWSFTSGPRELLGQAAAEPCLDLQRLLLLRLAGPGQPVRWLWLQRTWAPERWNAVRRAVYCRPPPAA